MRIFLTGNNMNIHSQESGVTLFIAMVITATLLLISTGIVVLSIKEAQISNAGRESQYAFYAADTGIECALYWDTKSPSGSAFLTPGSTITCAGQSQSAGDSNPSIFDLTFPDNSCVTVTVTKNGSATTIESRGHNTCDLTSARRVERAIKVTY